jgi:hypothetical protein
VVVENWTRPGGPGHSGSVKDYAMAAGAALLT